MAKLKSPLFSHSASGALGDTLTYSKRPGAHTVRFQRKQKDIITDARTIQRAYFSTSARWWGEMTPNEQAGFDGYDEKDL